MHILLTCAHFPLYIVIYYKKLNDPFHYILEYLPSFLNLEIALFPHRVEPWTVDSALAVVPG